MPPTSPALGRGALLGQIKGDRARNILIGLVSDPCRDSGGGCSDGRLRPRRLRAPLIGLIQDPAVIVRASAAKALSVRRPARRRGAGRRAGRQGEHLPGQERLGSKYFVEALGSIGSTDAYPALLRALDDADETVAAQVIPALEKVAGFSYSEGRTAKQEREAWRRFVTNELRR